MLIEASSSIGDNNRNSWSLRQGLLESKEKELAYLEDWEWSETDFKPITQTTTNKYPNLKEPLYQENGIR